jgi:hypothetical protein
MVYIAKLLQLIILILCTYDNLIGGSSAYNQSLYECVIVGELLTNGDSWPSNQLNQC